MLFDLDHVSMHHSISKHINQGCVGPCTSHPWATITHRRSKLVTKQEKRGTGPLRKYLTAKILRLMFSWSETGRK